VEFRLGELGGDIEYATVAEWRKAVGEPVTAGEIVVEVEAEKVTTEIEAPVTGVLERIVAVEGDEIKVGTTIAVFAENG
jgi:pyruvate/2-oxoglutarate dehydrogenase complex dihydrolipoamide acyltransferase (E2) component